jgi:hypothetical protein
MTWFDPAEDLQPSLLPDDPEYYLGIDLEEAIYLDDEWGFEDGESL